MISTHAATATARSKAVGPAPAAIEKFGTDKDFSNLGDDADFSKARGGDLKGQARTALDRLQKTWGDDYPPAVYTAQVAQQPTTWIVQDTGGGTYVYAFDRTGSLKSSGSAGESGDWSWDHPASMPDAAS